MRSGRFPGPGGPAGTVPTQGVPLKEVIDDGFLRRYREFLDAEDTAFDELEHAVEEGDREHYELDLATWKDTVVRRVAFLERHEVIRPAAVSTPA